MMLTLNISGENRILTLETANKFPVFAAYLSQLSTFPAEPVFLDRDVTLFDKVFLCVRYGLPAKEQEVLWELNHYGIHEEGEFNEEDTNHYATKTLEQLQDYELFYVRTCCGNTFVTTKARISQLSFFRALFERMDTAEPLYSGTKDDPYFCEVTGTMFASILSHLRDPRYRLDSATKHVMVDMFAEKETTLNPVLSVTHVQPEENQNTLCGSYMPLVASDKSSSMMKKGVYEPPVKNIWGPRFKRVQKYSSMRSTLEMCPQGGGTYFSLVERCDALSQVYLEWNFRDIKTGRLISSERFVKDDPMISFKLVEVVELLVEPDKFEHIEDYKGPRQMRMSGIQLLQRMTLDANRSLQPSLAGTSVVHLCFPFFQHNNQALPMIALPNQHVKIRVTMKESMLPEGTEFDLRLRFSSILLDTPERSALGQNNYFNILNGLHGETVVNDKPKVITVIFSMTHRTTRKCVWNLKNDFRCKVPYIMEIDQPTIGQVQHFGWSTTGLVSANDKAWFHLAPENIYIPVNDNFITDELMERKVTDEVEVHEFIVPLSHWNHNVTLIVVSLHASERDEHLFNHLDGFLQMDLILNQHTCSQSNSMVAHRLEKLDHNLTYDSNTMTYVISFSSDPFNPIQATGCLGTTRLDNIGLTVKTTVEVGCVRVWPVFYSQCSASAPKKKIEGYPINLN